MGRVEQGSLVVVLSLNRNIHCCVDFTMCAHQMGIGWNHPSKLLNVLHSMPCCPLDYSII